MLYVCSGGASFSQLNKGVSSCRARSRLRRSWKRLVGDQLFLGCKRTGEIWNAKSWISKEAPKQKHKPNTKRKKTSRKLSETLRFQNNEILGALSTSSRPHSDSCKWKNYPPLVLIEAHKSAKDDRIRVEKAALATKRRIFVAFFFLLDCRTSTRHCRSTTGIEEDRNRISGIISHGSKTDNNQNTQKPTPNQTKNTKQQTKVTTTAREIRKKKWNCETKRTPLCPSYVLFHRLVVLHAVQ